MCGAPALVVAQTPGQWRADLDTVVAKVSTLHPKPFARITEREFDREVASLRHDIPTLSRDRIVVRFMALVASLRDGHSKLEPVDPNGFGWWFPIRYCLFADGLFVVAAAPEYRDLLGARVVRVGRVSAESAAAAVERLQGSDNEFGDRGRIEYLSNAVALHALGVSPATDSLALTVRDPSGATRGATIRPVRAPFPDDRWMKRGRCSVRSGGCICCRPIVNCRTRSFWPATRRYPCISGTVGPTGTRISAAERAMYMQFNSVARVSRGESFAAFVGRLFHEVDTRAVDRFILDIRYNTGGAGDILMPFIHEFIKRDAINRPGHLYLLVGRRTFSSGVFVEGYMLAHTAAILVGEPASAPLNHYGDGVPIRLPNSGLLLQVSTRYHQTTDYTDHSPWATIDFPAELSSTDYLSGRDPAPRPSL